MTIRKTTQPSPLTIQPKPKPLQPVAKKPLTIGSRDELSSGRSRSLRKALGLDNLVPPDLKAMLATRAAMAKLSKASAGAISALRSDAADPVREAAQRNMETVNSTSSFARALEAEADPKVRDEMVRLALNSEYPPFGSSIGDTTNLNAGLDDQKVVAAAIDHATRQGAVTQKDFDTAVSHLNEDQVEMLTGTLSIEGNNRGLGGAVELLGVAAKNAGYERAAAVALTSTDALIDKYYPTDADQRAAFGQVKDFIEQWDDFLRNDQNDPAIEHNALQFALGSAARLTARGNGYSPQELQDELKELGPRFTQETVARLGEAARFDGRVPGAIDSLSDAAQALADSGVDKADEFKVAAALGYTQSTQLITHNLDDDERKAALRTLNDFLAGRRDAFRDAATADEPYSLLRDPQAIDGINNLLAADPSMIPNLVNGGAEGEATLVQLMETITFNPAVPAELRDAFQARIDSAAQRMTSTAFESENVGGDALGRLFGLMQVAGNRAVAAAGERDPETATAVRDFAKDVISGVAGTILSAGGPVASIVGGAVLNQVLGSWLGTPPGPSSEQLRNAFADWLEQEGINPSSGEQTKEAFNRFLGDLIDHLRDVRPPPPNLESRIDALQDIRTNTSDGFTDTLLSADGEAGELRRKLEERRDEP